MKNLQLVVTSVLAATLLAACGGGDDDVVAPPVATVNQVPASASVSSVAYTQFGITQIAAVSETDDPLSTDTVTLAPTSETDDPAVI